jgi:hypothetical protein
LLPSLKHCRDFAGFVFHGALMRPVFVFKSLSLKQS